MTGRYKLAAVTVLACLAAALLTVGGNGPADLTTTVTGSAPEPFRTVQNKRREMMRVIVTLKSRPGDAPADLQDRVLADVAPLGVRVLRKYSHLPQMALSVSPEALEALQNHSGVAAVQADSLSAPTQ